MNIPVRQLLHMLDYLKEAEPLERRVARGARLHKDILVVENWLEVVLIKQAKAVSSAQAQSPIHSR